ncbi:MAG: amino acid adenylation domain-containing protein, partial [Rubripirellula sp.]
MNRQHGNLEPIAVVGMGCRLPGDSDSPDQFWELLREGRDGISQTPSDRWNLEKFYRPGESMPGKTQSRWGGYINGIELFDPSLFGISAREAAAMDPQQRLLLEVAYRAIEDSGHPAGRLAGENVSVFTGISSIDYAVASLSREDHGELGPYSNTGSSSSIAANRVSYCFDLRGPSVAVDTACSSSLVALHMACQSIWRGEAVAALAGGVNALLVPDFYIAFSQLGVLSPDGRCKTFDASANGYSRSEGAGMVMLKPLSDALRDDDRIYCTIRATALNQDGRTPGLTVPSGEQQEKLVRRACQLAGVDPSQIDYVEAHGTGTPVGDPIEAGALARVLGSQREDPCRIASVKTNIGHLEAGAGIASLIKVALAMHHEQIPPHLHLQQVNPEIELDQWNLRIPTTLEPWQRGDKERLAGINGFGYGGANAHVIVGEAPATNASTSVAMTRGNFSLDHSKPAILLPVSGSDTKSLAGSIHELSDWLGIHQQTDGNEQDTRSLLQIAGTAAHHRTHHEVRTAVVGRSVQQWQKQLDELHRQLASGSEGSSQSGISISKLPAKTRENGILFLCCGQGPQWFGMGRGLYQANQTYRETIDQIDAEFRKHTDKWTLVEELERDATSSQMHRTSIAQPALFALQVAQAEAWKAVGIRPTAIIGHSVGEIAAAHLSGGLNFEDACQVAVHRGRTMDLASSRGAMIAVGLSENEAKTRIAKLEQTQPNFKGQVSVAAINGPTSITMSGDCDAIEQLAVAIEADQIFCRRLAVEYAFHSAQMDPVQDELLRSLDNIQTQPIHTTLISTVTGKRADSGIDLGAKYWWDNVRGSVRYADAVMSAASSGLGIAVELGPHPVLAFATTECYGHTGHEVNLIASASRPKPNELEELSDEARCNRDEEAWLTSVAKLYQSGVDLDWGTLAPAPSQRVELPKYPMQYQAVWSETDESHRTRLTSHVHPLLGSADRGDAPKFTCRLDPKLHAYLLDHQVRTAAMLPAAAGIEMSLSAIKSVSDTQTELTGDDPISSIRLSRFRLLNPLVLDDSEPHHLQTSYQPDRRQIELHYREHHQANLTPLAITQWQTSKPLPFDATGELSLASIRERCSEPFTSTTCYEYCSTLGLNYGPLFRGIREGVRKNHQSVGLRESAGGEALSEICLSDEVLDEAFRSDASSYLIHPAVLDSCFHTMIAADSVFDRYPGGLYLPFEIAEIQIDIDAIRGAGIDRTILAHACIRSKDAHRLIADLHLYLEDGTPVGTLHGFESRRIGGESEATTKDLMYRYRWQTGEETENDTSTDDERLVIFSAGDLPEELVNQWDISTDKLVWVHPKAQSSARSTNVPIGRNESGEHHWVNPDDVNDFAALWDKIGLVGSPETGTGKTHFIYLWAVDVADPGELEAQPAAEACEQLRESTLWTTRAPLHLIQSLEAIEDTPDIRLTLVTLGAQSGDELDEEVAVTQMPLIGLGRVIVSESAFPTRLVDCDPQESPVLASLPSEWRRHDSEDEVMLRDGTRFVQRFVPDADREWKIEPNTDQEVPQHRLSKGLSSGVDELHHQAIRPTELRSGEVEIQVAGAGLNFSDVMKVLDLYPGLPPGEVALGAECSGVITRIADDVTQFNVNDKVIAIAPGGFASHVIVHTSLVAPSPEKVDLIEASALPVAWLTADHAIRQCARMQAGESILIHSASGGVGLAAIEIAQQIGVEVFATAGSDAKRDHVRDLGVEHVFDSRSLNFADEIKAVTSSREEPGVDAVLNSLPGEAIQAGLSLLKTGGRFLEIGKRDIYTDGSLGLYVMRNNLAMFAIDLDQLFKEKPTRMGQQLRELVRRFDADEPNFAAVKSFASGDAAAAFRFMQQAKHIGKVVVDYTHPPETIRSCSDNEFTFNTEGTYWLAGGLGGFGLQIANWMAKSGAGTLVLSGRSANVTQESAEVIQQMQDLGTNIVVMPCDITKVEDIRRCLAKIDAELPTLRGVVHTAMVLEDKLLVDLDRETLDRVLWPKVLGGWNLHQTTMSRDLDQFILFSSLSSVFGHAGQGNYSAANALLDGLAHHRRVSGLPATVVNWGHLGEVGYLAEREELSERLRRQGVLDFTVAEATECLARALNRRATQCSVLRMDWSRWRGLGLTQDVSPRFAHLIRGGNESEKSLSGDALRNAAPAERADMLQLAIAGKLASLLGTTAGDLDADRPMLEMGLDSLMAVELRNWIERQLELKLQIGALMRGSSLRSLVQTLSESVSGTSSANDDMEFNDPEMTDRNRFPMSDQQTGLWYSFCRDSGGTAFNVFLPARVRSKLDPQSLRKAIGLVVSRHASLRTTFTDENGKLEQVVHEALPPAFDLVDWTQKKWSDTELQTAVIAETQRPFDLRTGPLLRMKLFKLAEDDWIVVATTHHIVVDFWSLVLILGELRVHYPKCVADERIEIAPPEQDYFDFVADQRRLLASPRSESLKAYWEATLSDVPAVLEIPTDKVRPASFSGRAKVTGLKCSAELGRRINEVAKQTHTTSSSVVMAALQVLLSRYSGEEKFIIGSPFAGRTRSDLEDTVGFFVNMLPLVADLSGHPTFTDLVRRAGDRLVDSMQHEEYPFAQIVRDLDPPRDTSRSPLIQVSCTFEKAHVREEEGRAGYLFPAAVESTEIAGLRQENYYVPHQTCHYDLEFIFEQTGDDLHGMIVFCEDLYEEESVAKLAENFISLMSQLLDDTESRISNVAWGEDVITTRSAKAPAEPAPILQEFVESALQEHSQSTVWQNNSITALTNDPQPNDARAFNPQGRNGLRRLFGSGKQKPISPSLTSTSNGHEAAAPQERVLSDQTYRDTQHQIDAYANELVRAGVQPGQYVPVVAQPGSDAIAMILAVQKTAAVPVPIDSNQPSIDASTLLSQTKAELVFADDASAWTQQACNHAQVLWLSEIDVRPRVTLNPETAQRASKITAETAAYVIYTSGTSGKPKGVVVSHGAIANTLAWRSKMTPIHPGDRLLMPLSHQFDAGLGMCLFAFTQGAQLVWPECTNLGDISSIVNQIRRDRVTLLTGVPAWIDLIASHQDFGRCDQLRHIWIGGDAMPEGLPRLIRRSIDAQVWNCYGPTEAAVEATAYRVDDVQTSRRLPVGQPADHTEVVILDENLQIVPDTVAGQIALTGAGLATGYLADEQRTDAVFVELSLDGSSSQSTRVYLTGDRGRRRVDGLVEVLGRIDRQLKISGYRIEPGEIETVLQDHPLVAQAAVVTRKITAIQSDLLVAFIELDGEANDDPKIRVTLQHHLADQLPPYKRPQRLEIIPTLPKTTSGKVNFGSLPELSGVSIDEQFITPPSTSLERYLAEVWGEILEQPSIGVSQNFFELGGSSLQAAMLTNRLSDELKIEVPSSLLFDLADISAMAQRLTQLHREPLMKQFGERSVRFYDGDSRVRSGDVDVLMAPLKPTGSKTPLFMVHPPGGIVVCYRELASSMPEDQPLYAIRSRGLHGKESLPENIQAMAGEYVQAIRNVQASGPYRLGGWSIGGVIAMEVAQQLIAGGDSVERLVLLDTSIPSGASDLVPEQDQSNVGLEYGIDLSLDELFDLNPEEQLPFLWQHAEKMGLLDQNTPPEVAMRAIDDLKALFHHHIDVTRNYAMEPIDTSVLFVRPSDIPFQTDASEDRGWSYLAREVDVLTV